MSHKVLQQKTNISPGDHVIIPAGTLHNVSNSLIPSDVAS